MLNFCDFIQVYVFTTNHHLKAALHYVIYYIGLVWSDLTTIGLNFQIVMPSP